MDEELEFFSIKVPDGPAHRASAEDPAGDTVPDAQEADGQRWCSTRSCRASGSISSRPGTGIAPFAGTIRDPETYEKFDQIILTHTTRTLAELHYGEELSRR